jgi:VCBS repeat-containing protein
MTLFETGGGTGFGCIINNGVLEAATELDGGTQSGSYVGYNLVTDPLGLVGGDPTTEFNQYAVTITVNRGLQLYVNGVLVDETTSGSGADWDGGDGAGLGGFGENNHGGFINTATGTTYDATFLGQMAIVRLYSGVLTAGEIFKNFKVVDAGTDIDGDSLEVTGVIDGGGSFVGNGVEATLASGALVTMTDTSGGFDYDPNGAFDLIEGDTATDTFTYRVSDGMGSESEAAVTVTITGVPDAGDDELFAKEGQIVTFNPNAFLGNDERPVTPGTYIQLTSPGISGATWINTGSGGASRNGTINQGGLIDGQVVPAADLVTGFPGLGQSVTAVTFEDCDPISTGSATVEVWFKPDPGQTGKLTVFETGGNGNGFSIVYDADTGDVIANFDGGDDINNSMVATAGGVSTSEFNQVIVTIRPNEGPETAIGSGVFVDLMEIYLNNDPMAYDGAEDASAENLLGTSNDWCGTDNGGVNFVSGTTALNENFPAAAGLAPICRVYPLVLTPEEREANFDAVFDAITAVSSTTTEQGAAVTLNADGTVTVDYSGISLAPGAIATDSFTYTGSTGTATANVIIEALTEQEEWRLAYYGTIENEGPAEDSAVVINGLTNLQNFALDLDPKDGSAVLDVDAGSGTINSVGPPAVWIDPADGRIYLRHTRRTDLADQNLEITDQFSRDLLSFEDSTVDPTPIATGTGASGADIEAVQTEFPLTLPIGGGKARFGRIEVGNP